MKRLLPILAAAVVLVLAGCGNESGDRLGMYFLLPGKRVG